METPQVGDVWEQHGKRFHVTKVDSLFSTSVEEGVTDCIERWMNAFISVDAKLVERNGEKVNE